MKKLISIILSVVMVMACFMATVPAYAKIQATSSGTVNAYQESSPKKYDDETNKTKFVYYPEELESTDKKYPVIVWANGTGCAPALYIKLLREFANQGFVVVASSETMAADGTEQIACANYVINRSRDKDSVLYNKIATNKIVAMGHSQGGRSTVNAVSSSKLFCCAVSIAGSNYDYEAEKNSTPTLFFAGSSDVVVPANKWIIPAYNLATGPAAYITRVGAKHTECMTEVDDYVNCSVQWINAFANRDMQALDSFATNEEFTTGKINDKIVWRDFKCKNLEKNSFSGTIVSDGNIIIIASLGGIVVIAGVVIFMVNRKREKKA